MRLQVSKSVRIMGNLQDVVVAGHHPLEGLLQSTVINLGRSYNIAIHSQTGPQRTVCMQDLKLLNGQASCLEVPLEVFNSVFNPKWHVLFPNEAFLVAKSALGPHVANPPHIHMTQEKLANFLIRVSHDHKV